MAEKLIKIPRVLSLDIGLSTGIVIADLTYIDVLPKLITSITADMEYVNAHRDLVVSSLGHHGTTLDVILVEYPILDPTNSLHKEIQEAHSFWAELAGSVAKPHDAKIVEIRPSQWKTSKAAKFPWKPLKALKTKHEIDAFRMVMYYKNVAWH